MQINVNYGILLHHHPLCRFMNVINYGLCLPLYRGCVRSSSFNACWEREIQILFELIQMEIINLFCSFMKQKCRFPSYAHVKIKSIYNVNGNNLYSQDSYPLTKKKRAWVEHTRRSVIIQFVIFSYLCISKYRDSGCKLV